MRLCFGALIAMAIMRLVQGIELTVVMMMMVRDEEANVRANLGKWRSVADYVVCGVDERTSDGSGRAVAEIMSDRPHWVFYFRFENFGQARTVVLKEAWKKFSHATHALIIDPDWVPEENTLVKSELNFNHRQFTFLVYDRNGLTTRTVAWLIRHEEGLQFRYRLHEVLVLPGKSSNASHTLPGTLSWIVHEVELKGRKTWHTTEHANGTEVGHSMSYKRYLRDLDHLYLDLEDLGQDDPHTLYYLGATHLACIDAILGVGLHEPNEKVLYHADQGIHFLEMRTQPKIIQIAKSIGGNTEETWAAIRWLAHAYHNYKRDYQKAHYWYKQCQDIDPSRVDCATFQASLYRDTADITSAWNTILVPLQYDFSGGQRTFAHNFYIYYCTLPLEASLILLPSLQAQLAQQPTFLSENLTNTPGTALSNWLVLLAFGRRLLRHAELSCNDPSRKFISAQPEQVQKARVHYDALRTNLEARSIQLAGESSDSGCIRPDLAFAAANYDANHLAMLKRWGLLICEAESSEDLSHNGALSSHNSRQPPQHVNQEL